MGEWQTLITISHQVAQSSTQQGDCEPVLMDEDRPVPEDQDESEENEMMTMRKMKNGVKRR